MSAAGGEPEVLKRRRETRDVLSRVRGGERDAQPALARRDGGRSDRGDPEPPFAEGALGLQRARGLAHDHGHYG